MLRHAPTELMIRSLARERATTRESIGALASGKAGCLGSSTPIRNALAPPAFARANNAAIHAPVGPPPTIITSSTSAILTAQRNARPRARRGVGPANPALTRAKALLAGGVRS